MMTELNKGAVVYAEQARDKNVSMRLFQHHIASHHIQQMTDV